MQGVSDMTTAAIDIDILDELFENQKKLDDVLNSFFDDDSFFSSTDDIVPVTSPQKDSLTFQADEDFSLDSDDKYLDQKSRSIFHIIIPLIMEIVAIYYGIMYFT